mgnify:CR=1 FL=1
MERRTVSYGSVYEKKYEKGELSKEEINYSIDYGEIILEDKKNYLVYRKRLKELKKQIKNSKNIDVSCVSPRLKNLTELVHTYKKKMYNHKRKKKNLIVTNPAQKKTRPFVLKSILKNKISFKIKLTNSK